MSVPEIVCPLCETRQPNAWDCAACGHPLHERPALQVQVEAVPELDSGRDGAGDVFVDAMPDLEVHLAPSVQVAPELVPDLERGAAEPVPDLGGELVPDLERTEIAAREPAAGAPPAVVCRYCGTPAQPGAGIFCARCGMRVPVPARAAPVPSDAGELVICGCGAPRQRLGERCGRCGARVRAYA